MLINSELTSLLNDALNQSAKLRKGGNQLVYFCFKCMHYKRKLEVCLEEGPKFGIFNCWTCHISGNLGKLLYLVKAPQVYKDKLYALTKDIKILRNKTPKQIISDVVLPEEFNPMFKPVNSLEYKDAMIYLKSRGILYEDVLRYNIGYCETGPYAHHIIIPSYDANARLNFFMGRRYYQMAETIPHKKPDDASMDIIGFELFVNWNEPLNLCEGFFDAIAIRNNAIPLFGKYPSKKLQEAMIVNKVKRVNMVLDNDAMSDAVKNCQLINRLGIEVSVVKLNGKDPSKLGFEKVHELIQNAKPFGFDDLLEYKVQL